MDYTYVDTPDGFGAMLAELASEPLLGVDTEAAGYHRYLDRLSLLQISSRSRTFLVDPLGDVDLSGLGGIFSDARIEKIFHDADFDLRILDRDEDLRIVGLFDTQLAAAFLGERSLGLGAVLEKYLGLNLPKLYQRADWAERPLIDGMKDYAATDTTYLPDLRDRLRERLTELDRLAWAEEEFERREQTRFTGGDGEREAFLRVKGARDLKPRGLAILRELHGWREEVGRERDQATFRVMPNQALIAMSLAPPRDANELRKVSGVGEGIAARRGDEILAALRRGLEVPDGELTGFPPSKRWDRDPESEARADRLRAARNAAAETLGLDPGFLISRAVLDEIARRDPADLDALSAVPDVRRWQVTAIGEPLLRALRG